MPIVRIADKLVYFAHVPKCAGTAIELYLQDAFGPLAFRNTSYNAIPQQDRWTRSSPQHVTVDALAELFPDPFFDATFAVVRSPVTRLVSAFRFNRDISGSIPTDMAFGDWLATVQETQAISPWQFDNHTRTMDEIVPPTAQVFRLEDGLDPVVAWLQKLAGADMPLPPTIRPRNVLDTRLAFENKPIRPVTATQADVDQIYNTYRVDFERFNYDPITGNPIL